MSRAAYYGRCEVTNEEFKAMLDEWFASLTGPDLTDEEWVLVEEALGEDD